MHQTWARVGQTPQCPTLGRRKGVKVFGAISGSRRFRFRVQTAYFNKETFVSFLHSFRRSLDGYIIMILDGASYHKGDVIAEFLYVHRRSFELEYLPSYSPELNPQEHVWKLFRKEHIHNRCMTDTADLLSCARGGLRALQRSGSLHGIYRECHNYFCSTLYA